MAENPFNEEMGFFSLMKNHTKYFSNCIKIFNLKKKKSFGIWWLPNWLDSTAHEKKLGLQVHFPCLCLAESTV